MKIKIGTSSDLSEGEERRLENGYGTFDVSVSTETGFTVTIIADLVKSIKSDDLLFGNDWDYDIKPALPYGTAIGIKMLKAVDPSVDGDLYADEPYLYGKAMQSFSTIRYEGEGEGNVKEGEVEKDEEGQKDLKEQKEQKEDQENKEENKVKEVNEEKEEQEEEGIEQNKNKIEEDLQSLNPEIPRDYQKRKVYFSKHNIELKPGKYEFVFTTGYISFEKGLKIVLPKFNLDLGWYLDKYLADTDKSVNFVLIAADGTKEESGRAGGERLVVINVKYE